MLVCHGVGLPEPNRNWRGPSGNFITPSSGNRHQRVLPDGVLTLGPLRPEDAGNYSCLAENVFGRDEITYEIIVQVPPGAPHLSVPATTTCSLALQWRLPDNGGSPVIGEFCVPYFVYCIKHNLIIRKFLKVTPFFSY